MKSNYVIPWALMAVAFVGCGPEEQHDEVADARAALSSVSVKLSVSSATADDVQSPNVPARVLDGNLSTRWSGFGDPVNLYLDLGAVATIDYLKIAFFKGDQRTSSFQIYTRVGTSGPWNLVGTKTSNGRTTARQTFDVRNSSGRYVRFRGTGNSINGWNSLTEVEVWGTGGTSGGSGTFGLNPNAEPWQNFDLSQWALDTPAPRDNDACRAERTWDYQWDDPNPLDSSSAPFFFTHSDGGMRFVTRIDGETTSSSCSSGFVRSELREMLRGGNRNIEDTGVTLNNWALGYQPSGSGWGGRNGTLNATLRVNKVTTSGNSSQVGRVIIGQIHADDDEPLRLYYRKRSGQSKGCIYFAHEIRNGSDVDFFMIGNESCTSGPSDGIALNELFSYTINNTGANISVTIRRGDFDGPIIAAETINMNGLNSGYDRSDEWMYFKAGAYTQNNSGNGSDGDIVTFYRLSKSHGPN